jgi:hypothetical protein
MSATPVIESKTKVTAKFTAQEWIGIIGSFAFVCTYGWTALRNAEAAAGDAKVTAEKALSATQATQTQLEGALVQMSAKLGRIEGLLEMMQRGSKP